MAGIKMFLSHYEIAMPAFYVLNLLIKIFATPKTYHTLHKNQYTSM